MSRGSKRAVAEKKCWRLLSVADMTSNSRATVRSVSKAQSRLTLHVALTFEKTEQENALQLSQRRPKIWSDTNQIAWLIGKAIWWQLWP